MMPQTKRLIFLLGIGLFLTLIVSAQERRPATFRRYQIRWNANLSAAQTNSVSIGGKTYFSASKLQVSWNAPDIPVDHYEVSATDAVRSSATRFSTHETSLTLTGLKSGTLYIINLRACREANCQIAYDAGIVTVATPEEFWQLQGTGNTIAAATRIISDGNVGSHAFRFGAWAGANFAGRIQLYYNPMSGSEKGVKLGLTNSADDTLANFSAFSALSNYGLRSPCPPAQPPNPPPPCPGNSLVRSVALFQAVPLSSQMGGKVRLFFEANGTDLKNRILYLDSQDGYLGRDFNAGAATLCQSLTDYSAGGACEPKVAIGVAGDATGDNPRILHTRQHKIGYPTRDDIRWDGAPGTYMVFTVNTENCSNKNTTQGYAVWDGSKWLVQYAANGCPKLFEAMQAPMPVHLGGVQYKLYFNNNNSQNGQPNDPQTTVKPMKVTYADGALTGDPTRVDFEDWETVAEAHNLNYLWPDGTLMDDATESRLDDYVILLPTNDPNLQVMYTNMAGPAPSIPVIGMAVLINP